LRQAAVISKESEVVRRLRKALLAVDNVANYYVPERKIWCQVLRSAAHVMRVFSLTGKPFSNFRFNLREKRP
jgi:hypothetical protein